MALRRQPGQIRSSPARSISPGVGHLVASQIPAGSTPACCSPGAYVSGRRSALQAEGRWFDPSRIQIAPRLLTRVSARFVSENEVGSTPTRGSRPVVQGDTEGLVAHPRRIRFPRPATTCGEGKVC